MHRYSPQHRSCRNDTHMPSKALKHKHILVGNSSHQDTLYPMLLPGCPAVCSAPGVSCLVRTHCGTSYCFTCCLQAAMYDALLSGAAGVTEAEQEMLQAVRAQVSNWRLRKRFDTAAAAEAYRKATAFEALVSMNQPGGKQSCT